MRTLLLLWAMFLALPALAERVPDLYSAQVPVTDRTPAGRAAAVRAALKKVLVKLSGRRGPQVPADLLAKADDWVDQFRYLETEDPAAPLALAVRFDGTALIQAMKARGMPLWPPDRPLVLLWAGAEEGGRRRLLQSDTDPQALAALQEAAAARGLPLLLPLGDLEDRKRLQAGDLWGGFDERIRTASRRYRPDLVWVVLARKRRGGWQVQWRLPGSNDQGKARGKTLEGALSQVLDQAVDRIATRYLARSTTAGGETPGLRLELAGITGIADLRRFAGFLDGHQAIGHWAFAAVEDDRAWFRIEIPGGSDAFLALPGLRNLAEPEGPAEDEDPAPDLVLRLLP